MNDATKRPRRQIERRWPVDGFHPELVGKLKGYPRTAEAHERMMTTLRANRTKAMAEGRLNRRGVPNGYAGRKAEVVAIRRNAQTEAERLLPELCPDLPPLPKTLERSEFTSQEAFDEARVAAALLVNLTIAIDPTYRPAERRRCARTFLEFSIPKPAARTALAADGGPAEFLAELARANTK